MEMVNELYDYLDREPSSVMVRELILEQWIHIGDVSMATGMAEEIQALEPSNIKAKAFLNMKEKAQNAQKKRPSTKKSAAASGTATASSSRTPAEPSARPLAPQPSGSKKHQMEGPKKQPIKLGKVPESDGERTQLENQFSLGWVDLKSKAESLLYEMQSLATMGQIGDDAIVEDLQAIVDGRISSVIAKRPPRPIRELARDIASSEATSAGDHAATTALVVEDLEDVLEWTLSEQPTTTPDALRKRLLQRRTLLEAALPAALGELCGRAFTHVEHRHRERFSRRYANTETMLGDDVADIPAENLLVTEDNFAWDMDELAAALAANGGVMRNPLTKDMFGPDDVRRILAHPLGQRLRPLALAQSELRKGVRPGTIAKLAALSATMLADQSADAAPSMAAVDEFLSYVATLPAAEQKTLDELKIPGTDSHTGLAYDYTVGESVRDAKANRTCFHKTGDFLGQAARFLKTA